VNAIHYIKPRARYAPPCEGAQDKEEDTMANDGFDLPVVRMGDGDPDSIITAAMAERYAMPAVVVAAMKQAGKHLSIKMLKLVESDKFDKLPVATQLKVAEFVFDRAFGKSDRAAIAMALSHRVNPSPTLQDKTASSRLRTIEQKLPFPEMQKTRSERLSLPSGSSPEDPDVSSKRDGNLRRSAGRASDADSPPEDAGEGRRRPAPLARVKNNSTAQDNAGAKIINMPRYEAQRRAS